MAIECYRAARQCQRNVSSNFPCTVSLKINSNSFLLLLVRHLLLLAVASLFDTSQSTPNGTGLAAQSFPDDLSLGRMSPKRPGPHSISFPSTSHQSEVDIEVEVSKTSPRDQDELQVREYSFACPFFWKHVQSPVKRSGRKSTITPDDSCGKPLHARSGVKKTRGHTQTESLLLFQIVRVNA